MSSDQDRTTHPLVRKIEADLNNRRGFHLYSLDDDIREEILSSWDAWARAHDDQVTADSTRQARVEELERVLELLVSPKPTSEYKRSLAYSRTVAGVRARLTELDTDATS